MAALALHDLIPQPTALLLYADGRGVEIPIAIPSPVTILERVAPGAMPGPARQRRFVLLGRNASGAFRYAEIETLEAEFRCGACGCASELAFAPRPRDLAPSPRSELETVGRAAWLLCGNCYPVAVRGCGAMPGAFEPRPAIPMRSPLPARLERVRAARAARAAGPGSPRAVSPSTMQIAPPAGAPAAPCVEPARSYTTEERDALGHAVRELLRRVDPFGLSPDRLGPEAYADQAIALALELEPGMELREAELRARVRAAFGRAPDVAAPTEWETAFGAIADGVREHLARGGPGGAETPAVATG